jgi:hypothetical protein
VVGVLTGELMPARVRGVGSAVAQALGGVANTAIASLFPALADAQLLDVTFYTLGAVILLFSGVCWCWLPHTEGRALEDIEHHLSLGSAGSGTSAAAAAAADDDDADKAAAATQEEVGALRRKVAGLQGELAQARAHIASLQEALG